MLPRPQRGTASDNNCLSKSCVRQYNFIVYHVYLCRIGSRNLWDSDTDNCDHHLYFNVSTDADTQTVLLIRAVAHLEVEKGADPATHCEIQNVVYLTPAHGKMLTALHPNLPGISHAVEIANDAWKTVTLGRPINLSVHNVQ